MTAINKAGTGTGSVGNVSAPEVQDLPKSAESEKKLPDGQQTAPKPYRASSQEVANRKGEAATTEAAQKAALNIKYDSNAKKNGDVAAKPPEPKKTSKQESESLWESMKKAGQFVSVDLMNKSARAIGHATGKAAEKAAPSVGDSIASLPKVAAGVGVGVADAIASVGADGIRRQGIEQLDRRRHPQDIVPGQMFEVEEINLGSTDKIETKKHSEVMTSAATTLPMNMGDHPKQYRNATQAGLKERLKELNDGGQLTDFEKELVSKFDAKHQGSPGEITLSPIKGVDKGQKMDSEVQAYKVTTGGSGDRETVYYDRNGNVLREAGHREKPLVNEGLGPIEYLGYAQLAKHVVTKIGAKVGERLAAKEAGNLAKAETAVGSRSVDPKASTQPQAVPAPQAPPPQPVVPPNAGTMADNSIPPVNLKGRPGIQPGWTPTRPGSSGTSLAPHKTDAEMFPIKTPKGTENMSGLEYRLRLAEAQGWISKNHKPRWVGDGPSPQLYKKAEEMFGLNDGWWANWNPMRKKIGGAF